MVHMTRRQAIQLSGSVILTGLTGCSAFESDSAPTPTLGKIRVTNLDFRPHTVSVLILDEEEPVYSAEMDVAAAKPEENDSSAVATASGGSFTGFSTEVENSTLYAWRDRQPVSEWEEFDFREQTASCLGLDIRIGDRMQSRASDVTILHTTDPTVCKDTRSRDANDGDA